MAPRDEPGLDLVWDEMKAKRRQQEQRAQMLDAKASALLGAGSLVTVASSARLNLNSLPVYSIVLTGVAFVCYLALLWMLRHSIRPRDFNYPPRVDSLYPDCVDHSPSEVKHAILKEMVSAYRSNEQELRYKADAVEKALVLLLIVAVAVTLAQGLS